jgi:hypothetical protein
MKRIEAWIKNLINYTVRPSLESIAEELIFLRNREEKKFDTEDCLLKMWTAVSYAIDKVESDRDLAKKENLHMQQPEAFRWACHYMHERGWEIKSTSSLLRLVDKHFTWSKEHREFLFRDKVAGAK